MNNFFLQEDNEVSTTTPSIPNIFIEDEEISVVADASAINDKKKRKVPEIDLESTKQKVSPSSDPKQNATEVVLGSAPRKRITLTFRKVAPSISKSQSSVLAVGCPTMFCLLCKKVIISFCAMGKNCSIYL